MRELMIDFGTTLDGYASGMAGPAGGVSKGRSTSPGSASNHR